MGESEAIAMMEEFRDHWEPDTCEYRAWQIDIDRARKVGVSTALDERIKRQEQETSAFFQLFHAIEAEQSKYCPEED
jgi:hypothetical protein